MFENKIQEKIDFVILWVDGNDPKWLEEKDRQLKLKGQTLPANRYRDYGTLQYLFRGIEKYASWVNKIYFVTWGHVPNWLNLNNEKIVVIKHEEFIPSEYLPTFNSNVIEMNLHRIENLSENFVLFNDDLFILNNLVPNDFFEDNLPKDMYIEFIKKNPSDRHKILKQNYMNIAKKYFSKKKFKNQNLSKIFNLNYGCANIYNFMNILKKDFQDIYSPHLTQTFKKSNFYNIWEKEFDLLNEACKNKFRASSDIGTVICRYFHLLTGEFVPSKILGKYFNLSNNNQKLIAEIENGKSKIICINDSSLDVDFDKCKKELKEAFEKRLNEKSSFEV